MLASKGYLGHRPIKIFRCNKGMCGITVIRYIRVMKGITGILSIRIIIIIIRVIRVLRAIRPLSGYLRYTGLSVSGVFSHLFRAKML